MPGFIPWTTIDLRLRSGRSIWIATTRSPRGHPTAAPTPSRSGTSGTARASTSSPGGAPRRPTNLAGQPWAVVHAGDGDDAIILEGPAEIVTHDEELRRIDAAYRDKYVDPHSGARASIFNDGDDLYRVRVRRAMAWAYGVVASRTDWTFEE